MPFADGAVELLTLLALGDPGVSQRQINVASPRDAAWALEVNIQIANREGFNH